mmetsp:Transcript_34440/g.97592  ORF Transcript_34440/g.97592 Transcript_34440/m.97592 type:complete len:232 (-) Transcript_34440:909-1604(-)
MPLSVDGHRYKVPALAAVPAGAVNVADLAVAVAEVPQGLHIGDVMEHQAVAHLDSVVAEAQRATVAAGAAEVHNGLVDVGVGTRGPHPRRHGETTLSAYHVGFLAEGHYMRRKLISLQDLAAVKGGHGVVHLDLETAHVGGLCVLLKIVTCHDAVQVIALEAHRVDALLRGGGGEAPLLLQGVVGIAILEGPAGWEVDLVIGVLEEGWVGVHTNHLLVNRPDGKVVSCCHC